MSFNFVDFLRSVLVNELLNVHESTTYSYENVVTLFDFDENSFLAKLINTLGFSQKKNSEIFSFGVSVKNASKSLINLIGFIGMVNLITPCTHNYFKSMNLMILYLQFVFNFLHLLKHF
jgi:hypothetical protein